MKLTKAQLEGLKKLEAGNFEVTDVDCSDKSKVWHKTGVSSTAIKNLEKKGVIKHWGHVLGVMPATPICCATCEWLSPEGLCEMFLQYPPLEYIKVEHQCPQWEAEIPF